MKSQFIFAILILLALSGCQSIKKSAVVVTPIYLPISPKEGDKPLETLYVYLKNKDIRLKVVSKDPFIYQIPRQKGLLEELVKILETARSISNVHAMNLANCDTTKDTDGKPYRRKEVIVNKELEIDRIVDDKSPLRLSYDPGHPHADKEGYVKYPNVDALTERINIMETQRLYTAILKLIENTYQNGVVF